MPQRTEQAQEVFSAIVRARFRIFAACARPSEDSLQSFREVRTLGSLLAILLSFEAVEQVVAEGFIEVELQARHDFVRERLGAAVRTISVAIPS